MKTTLWVLGPVCCLLAAGACSSSSKSSGFGDDSSDGGGGGGGGNDDGGGGGGGDDGGIMFGDSGGGGGGGSCKVTDPNADMDHDGWSTAQGDCNDCDPNVNPGAIDVLHMGDGGSYWGNESCAGMPGANAKPCDMGLQLADTDPNNGAKAIELCATATMNDKKYGVLSAQYVRANGTPYASPGLQVGIEPSFGTNVPGGSV